LFEDAGAVLVAAAVLVVAAAVVVDELAGALLAGVLFDVLDDELLPQPATTAPQAAVTDNNNANDLLVMNAPLLAYTDGADARPPLPASHP
jgi:hypothetical protein